MTYIGQTTRSLSIRRNQHLRYSRKDTNNAFHCALLQYGESSFEWEVVEEFSGDKDHVLHFLNVAEEYHILKNDSTLDGKGYNSTQGGYGSDKFANVLHKRRLQDARAKAVLQYDLDGNFIREYESVTDVSRVMGVSQLSPYLVSKKPWRGYQWRYKTERDFPRKIDAFVKAKRNSPVLAYSTDGNFYKEYDSLNQCRIELGKFFSIREEIEDISIGERFKDTMLIFRKKDNDFPRKINVSIIPYKNKDKESVFLDIPVVQFNRNGEYIKEFPSIIEAHRQTGISESTIRTWCSKEEPLVVRDKRTLYVWRYTTDATKDRVLIAKTIKRDYVKNKMEHRVVQCHKDGTILKVWDNIRDASSATNIPYSHIWRLCSGATKKSKYGYLWKIYSPDIAI